uniref:VanZ-like domain-containing protein n=1 Tax=Moniliophthora roreri TaxID=221103 RepID=A0A0W0F0A9_MONRR
MTDARWPTDGDADEAATSGQFWANSSSRPSPADAMLLQGASDIGRLLHKFSKTVMKSYRLRFSPHGYDNPLRLRLRPWFILFTSLVMLSLAFLGFTNFSHSLPLNDKLLHFICFWLATFVFYFIVDVDEDARRIWFWRYFGVMATLFVCFFCGGIVSEFVQSLLPYKEFDIGDIAANLLGSSIGLYTAFYVEKYYRHRREIARLYRPLDTDDPVSDEDEDLDASDELVLSGTQLLPLSYQRRQAQTLQSPLHQAMHPPAKDSTKIDGRLKDVWDEREELFGIGDDVSDDGYEEARQRSGGGGQTSHDVPKIFVTNSESPT